MSLLVVDNIIVVLLLRVEVFPLDVGQLIGGWSTDEVLVLVDEATLMRLVVDHDGAKGCLSVVQIGCLLVHLRLVVRIGDLGRAWGPCIEVTSTEHHITV